MKKAVTFLITTLILLSWFPPPTTAQEALSLEIEAGFDGFYKADYWTPVQVTIANQGADLQAKLRFEDTDSYGNTQPIYTYPVELPRQSRKQLTLNLPLSRQTEVTIQLVDGEGTVLIANKADVEPLEFADFLVGVVGDDLSLLNALAGLNTPNNNRVAVAHLAIADLPVDLHTWQGLDMLVFNDVDTSQLTPTQQEALAYWVSQGGRLVIGGGPTAAQTLAGLKPLLPFSTIAMQTLAHPLPGLEAFLRANPLENSGGIPDRGPYLAAIPTETRGEIVVQEKNWPLIVSMPQDAGQIHYIALDLGLAPLDTLAGQPAFLPKLVNEFNPSSHFFDNNQWRGIRRSLTLIPDQTLPTPGAVSLYLVLYILAIGPVNYVVLGRLKRREWAWFSIPLIILLFCGVGYVSSFRLRGGRPLLRQITVLQSESQAAVARVDSFIGIYSPSRTAYTLEMAAATLIEDLSDSNFQNKLAITSGSLTQVENLQADIGGMPTIIAHSQLPAPHITANLNRNGQTIQGTIINDTGQEITHAYFIEGNNISEVGTIPSGETQIDNSFVPHYSSSNFYDVNGQRNPRQAVDLASRDIALKTILGIDDYGNWNLNVPGLYLVGWQADSPIEVTLANSRSDARGDTLLLLGLPSSGTP